MAFPRHRRPATSIFAAVLALATLPGRPAFAQAIAALVNGDVVTTTEIEEQAKFRRLLKQSAGRAETLDELIADRIKLRAANREGVDASDASFAQTMSDMAKKAGTSAQGLIGDVQRLKINIDVVRQHVRSLAAWNDLVKNRYKALSVSEGDVDAAIAKDNSLSRGDTDYVVQQIVFVVPVKATAGEIEQRMREAQALRGRFQDCASGIPLARALPDVAVKPPMTKTAQSLSEDARKELLQTQRGRLTTPSRTQSGIEMIAVCSKDDDNNRTSVREGVQSTLLTARLSKEADKMYQVLRAQAVVEKR